jgi:DNA-binding transcriptional ArsR family regulator
LRDRLGPLTAQNWSTRLRNSTRHQDHAGKPLLDSSISNWQYSQMAMEPGHTDRLSSTFHALSDPTRRAILARLALGEASVAELTEPFRLSQPTISKHLRVLENAGLIEGGRDAQRRPRRLAPQGMQDIADWIEPFLRQWDSRFDRLDAHLAKRKKQET